MDLFALYFGSLSCKSTTMFFAKIDRINFCFFVFLAQNERAPEAIYILLVFECFLGLYPKILKID